MSVVMVLVVVSGAMEVLLAVVLAWGSDVAMEVLLALRSSAVDVLMSAELSSEFYSFRSVRSWQWSGLVILYPVPW